MTMSQAHNDPRALMKPNWKGQCHAFPLKFQEFFGWVWFWGEVSVVFCFCFLGGFDFFFFKSRDSFSLSECFLCGQRDSPKKPRINSTW